MKKFSVFIFFCFLLIGIVGCGERTQPKIFSHNHSSLPDSPWGPEGTPPPPMREALTPVEECENNLKNIGLALEFYAVNHEGKYPENLSQLDKDILEIIPTDPVTGEKYNYLPSSDFTNYELKCPNPEAHGLSELRYTPEKGIIKY